MVRQARIVSGRYIYSGGGIAASRGSAHPLKRFEMDLLPTLPNVGLYFAAAVEEATGYGLEGRIIFWNSGSPKFILPLRINTGGYGQTVVNSVVRTDDLVVPPFVVNRQNWNLQQHTWQQGKLVPPDGLCAAWTWTDDAASAWLYHATMAPVYLTGNWDRVSWEPDDYFGTPTATTSMAAVILAVSQNP